MRGVYPDRHCHLPAGGVQQVNFALEGFWDLVSGLAPWPRSSFWGLRERVGGCFNCSRHHECLLCNLSIGDTCTVRSLYVLLLFLIPQLLFFACRLYPLCIPIKMYLQTRVLLAFAGLAVAQRPVGGVFIRYRETRVVH